MDNLEQIVAAGRNKAERWASVAVVAQYSEAADTPEQAIAKWGKIYREFGAGGEPAQDEVFGAVNMYFLRNGCSPEGKYSKPIRTAGGVEVSAGKVVNITGKQEGEIRQFMRGRLEDSYLFLKNNKEVVEDPELRARAETAGVPQSYCWLLADWLGETCMYFEGPESDIYRRLRGSVIAMANRRRANGTPSRDKVLVGEPEVQESMMRGVESGTSNSASLW